MPAWRADVLVFEVMVIALEQAHMNQPRIQVLEKMHVIGVEARVIVKIISGCDGEGYIRQLHSSKFRMF